MSVQQELDRFVEDGARRAGDLGEDYQQLWDAVAVTARSGKHLRPTLLLASYEAHRGADRQLAERVGAAVELLHTALVIHDDVIDGDHARHGALNVSGRFALAASTRGATPDRSGTVGMAAGILAGDLALAGAIRSIALCGADQPVVAQLLDLVDHAVHVSAAGELDDVVMSTGTHPDGSMENVLLMEECKTAVYSFQLPLQAGAVLAGVPPQAVADLADVGRLAGVGYQLVDDLRGVFSDEATTGKSALGDLREGKVTPLIAHARQTPFWPQIAAYVGDAELDESRAAAARALLDRSGSRAFVEELAERHLRAAVRSAEELGLHPSLTAELSRLTDLVLRSCAA